MSGLTIEQQNVVDAPMVPLCVIACAGSGKTKTAVHRLVRMRRELGKARGRVALLSFSNVAVDTFRKAYDDLSSSLPSGAGRSRVDIDTLDGFITAHIVRPHGHRTMKSPQAAFLVTGDEAFLEGYKFPTASFPQSIKALNLAFVKGKEAFFYVFNDQVELVDGSFARELIARLGRTGAYTHGHRSDAGARSPVHVGVGGLAMRSLAIDRYQRIPTLARTDPVTAMAEHETLVTNGGSSAKASPRRTEPGGRFAA